MAILWKDIYKVGNDEIDLEHQELFNKANMFLSAIGTDHLQESALEFFNYTREHFDNEEVLMFDVSYPGREYHSQQHVELIKRLSYISESISSNSSVHKSLELFIYEWLLVHICKFDSRLSAYISNMQQK